MKKTIKITIKLVKEWDIQRYVATSRSLRWMIIETETIEEMYNVIPKIANEFMMLKHISRYRDAMVNKIKVDETKRREISSNNKLSNYSLQFLFNTPSVYSNSIWYA